MTNDDLKLLEMALWGYMTLFAGGALLSYVIDEARKRRRIARFRKIVRSEPE